MQQYDIAKVELTTIPADFSYMKVPLNAWVIKPNNFDASKKYPVLLYQYSGPGSQEVADKFPIKDFFWYQMLAQKGYIIVCVDGVGTGFRGAKFKKATYLQLGKYESEDQMNVAKYFASLSYVDPSRIGIWGWSFGGFMSATCILKGNSLFKTAVSVAPVTNWRYYDNIYTERYMRTPQENAAGYDDNAPDQMAHMCRLIWIYTVRPRHKGEIFHTDAGRKVTGFLAVFAFPRDHGLQVGGDDKRAVTNVDLQVQFHVGPFGFVLDQDSDHAHVPPLKVTDTVASSPSV